MDEIKRQAQKQAVKQMVLGTYVSVKFSKGCLVHITIKIQAFQLTAFHSSVNLNNDTPLNKFLVNDFSLGRPLHHPYGVSALICRIGQTRYVNLFYLDAE